ncbi:MAG TPA: hypothetical protein PLG20_08330 [Candidatus Syntrophosphaera sp.]|nr:hypothetical protein [Candidatus Syntrophosphaera sp.]
MSLFDDLYGGEAGIDFVVLKSGEIVFSSAVTGYTVQAMCIAYDPDISLDSIPDRFNLCAEYYVLARWYSDKDANMASYYHSLYEIEWAKARHNRLKNLMIYLGSDL